MKGNSEEETRQIKLRGAVMARVDRQFGDPNLLVVADLFWRQARRAAIKAGTPEQEVDRVANHMVRLIQESQTVWREVAPPNSATPRRRQRYAFVKGKVVSYAKELGFTETQGESLAVSWTD